MFYIFMIVQHSDQVRENTLGYFQMFASWNFSQKSNIVSSQTRSSKFHALPAERFMETWLWTLNRAVKSWKTKQQLKNSIVLPHNMVENKKKIRVTAFNWSDELRYNDPHEREVSSVDCHRPIKLVTAI